MKRALVVLSLLIVVGTGLLGAQTPAVVRQPDQPADRLPVRRVVLYKSGVGYFEHVGRVRGNQNVTIEFTSGQLDDVLKSLTVLDLDGGRVTNVGYNSEAGLERRLGALRLPVGQQTSRSAFLSALRGAKLEVKSATARWAGRLLSVEQAERTSNGVSTTVDTISLVSDNGDVSTIALDPGVTVHIVEAELNQEVSRYLALVGSIRDQDVRRLTIATAGVGDRDLFVSYVSEVPVWKATYRLMLPADGDARAPLLQGWAIVDNTVGQDWDNVQLSLVAGAPQAFIQQISRPYYVQRPVVPLPARALLAPQTHQGAMALAGAGAVTGTVTDRDGNVSGAVVRVTRNGAAAGQAGTDQAGRYRIDNLAPGDYDVTISMQNYKTVQWRGVAVSGGMETVLNAALEVGKMTDTVTRLDAVEEVTLNSAGGSNFVMRSAGAGGGGRGGGTTIAGLDNSKFNVTIDGVTPERLQNALAAVQSDATGAGLGDLFEYKLKEAVTIRKNQSALVPIAAGEVEAERVSLWTRGSQTTRPLRAVWLKNTTTLTLDAGTFSVLDGQAFAGEGLMESLKPGERRLLSYAMDSGLNVDAKNATAPRRTMQVLVNRGMLTQKSEDRQTMTYNIRNENTEPRTLVIEHPVRAGWTLGGTATPVETTATWYRFRLVVAPKTTATMAVEEVHPVEAQVAISTMTDDTVTVLVRAQAIPAPLEASLREVVTRKTEIARLTTEMANRQSELDAIARDQQRLRENMQALKGSREERELLQRYVRQLGEQESRLEVVRADLARLTTSRQQAQADLARFIEGLKG